MIEDNKKDKQFSEVEELENSLSPSEKDKYNKNVLLTIDVMKVCSFALGLFTGLFGIILYLFYDIWIKQFQLESLPSKIREWYINHPPIFYCVVGSIINISVKLYILQINVSNTTSVWG